MKPVSPLLLNTGLRYAYANEKGSRTLKDNEVAINFTQINLNFAALVQYKVRIITLH